VSPTDGRSRVGVSSSKLREMQDKDSRTAYCKVGADLTTFCLLIVTERITEFKQIQFTPEMADTGQRFIASLRKRSTDDQDEALQAFLFAVFSQKRCGAADKFSFAAYSFLVIYSFTINGTLRACGYFSQYFSKVIFFGRLAVLKAILAQVERENAGFFE